jgi:hypothetical protein
MLIVGILDFASFRTIYTPSQHHLNKLEKSLFQTSFVPQWSTVVVGQNLLSQRENWLYNTPLPPNEIN